METLVLHTLLSQYSTLQFLKCRSNDSNWVTNNSQITHKLSTYVLYLWHTRLKKTYQLSNFVIYINCLILLSMSSKHLSYPISTYLARHFCSLSSLMMSLSRSTAYFLVSPDSPSMRMLNIIWNVRGALLSL